MASKAIDMYLEHKETQAANAAKQPKPFPHRGQTCVLRHQVKRNSAGDVVGLNRADRDTRAVITAVYLDGKVRTGTSDVWDVKPSTNNTWETVNPLREEK